MFKSHLETRHGAIMEQCNYRPHSDYFKSKGRDSRVGQGERKEGDYWTCELSAVASFQRTGCQRRGRAEAGTAKAPGRFTQCRCAYLAE